MRILHQLEVILQFIGMHLKAFYLLIFQGHFSIKVLKTVVHFILFFAEIVLEVFNFVFIHVVSLVYFGVELFLDLVLLLLDFFLFLEDSSF